MRTTVGLSAKAVAGLLAISSSAAWSGQWAGHLATLFQAQIDCTNTDSEECLPYLAEAVAVADVLGYQAKTIIPSNKRDDPHFSVAFDTGAPESCTANWLQSMNGESLLHSALGLPVVGRDAKSTYWVAALMRASRQLCHS
jgi:hypothetical protein